MSVPGRQRWMALLWPAFLGAAVLDGIVFSFFDPQTIHLPFAPTAMLGWSDLAVYSTAFFVFWAVGAAIGWLVLLLSAARDEVNALPP